MKASKGELMEEHNEHEEHECQTFENVPIGGNNQEKMINVDVLLNEKKNEPGFLKKSQLTENIETKPFNNNNEPQLKRQSKGVKNNLGEKNCFAYFDSNKDLLSSARKLETPRKLDTARSLQENINESSRIIKFQSEKQTANLFSSMGIYYLENLDKTSKMYFNVLHRKMVFQASNVLENFFFQDVTCLVNYKLNQLNENFKKQKIFAKISHEFKTPLNSILGIINIIKAKQNKVSKAMTENLDIITNLSNYVIFLISDIIQYVNSQIIDEIKLNITEINTKEIMEFCYQILNSLLKCNKLKSERIVPILAIRADLDNIKAESDEIRLKQILLNFISNSVKFTREGKIQLKCKLQKNEAKDRDFHLILSVKDTGIGIKEEDKAKLFRDFGMLNITDINNINNKFGTGLGLSICKTIVEKLKIKLNFKSRFSQGSTFWISIPCTLKKIFDSTPNKFSRSKSSSKSNQSSLDNINIISCSSQMDNSVLLNNENFLLNSQLPPIQRDLSDSILKKSILSASFSDREKVKVLYFLSITINLLNF